jgi:hypothetical protein
MSLALSNLPRLKIDIDLDKYLSSYLVVRSFQINWSWGEFVHISSFNPSSPTSPQVLITLSGDPYR